MYECSIITYNEPDTCLLTRACSGIVFSRASHIYVCVLSVIMSVRVSVCAVSFISFGIRCPFRLSASSGLCHCNGTQTTQGIFARRAESCAGCGQYAGIPTAGTS